MLELNLGIIGLIFSVLFSASEIALISATKLQIDVWVKQRYRLGRLAKFIIDFEKAFNVDDDSIQPNDDATGGRVIIIEGDLCNDYGCFQKILKSAEDLGNRPIDCLGIVPSNLVVDSEVGRISKPS